MYQVKVLVFLISIFLLSCADNNEKHVDKGVVDSALLIGRIDTNYHTKIKSLGAKIETIKVGSLGGGNEIWFVIST